MNPSLTALLDLPPADRIALAQAIWDSVADEPQHVPVTRAQREYPEGANCNWRDAVASAL